MAQSIILGLESRSLVLQSAAQFGVPLAQLRDLLLLLLNRFDDQRKQLAIGNAIGAIFVVLPFDQSQPALGSDLSMVSCSDAGRACSRSCAMKP